MATGSPPQVRGTFMRSDIRSSPMRLTPAGAGNITAILLAHVGTEAHPRRCGEHPERVMRVTSRSRLTPAGAGNILPPAGWFRQHQAHPRRCGEHAGETIKYRTLQGSPPQVRGTWRMDGGEHPPAGLTPAGAGNIGSAHVPLGQVSAHPRRCGEHGGRPGGESSP